MELLNRMTSYFKEKTKRKKKKKIWKIFSGIFVVVSRVETNPVTVVGVRVRTRACCRRLKRAPEAEN